MAETAECKACAEGMDVAAFCRAKASFPGCQPETKSPVTRAMNDAQDRTAARACCRALTAECMACAEGIEIPAFCRAKPRTPGCETDRPQQDGTT
eukprot:gene6036-4499_t